MFELEGKGESQIIIIDRVGIKLKEVGVLYKELWKQYI